MEQPYEKELSTEVKEKMKKNLVYVSIFSIVMLFAGFSSAYIVTMGDSFWLKTPFPQSYWLSTVIILVSSITFIIAIGKAKQNKIGSLKMWMSLTLVLGLAFMYFQFKGFGDLIDQGIHPINNHIMVTDGRYGDYYEIKMGEQFLEVDGNHFKLGNKELSDTQMKNLKDFMRQFKDLKTDKDFMVRDYANPHILYLNGYPLTLANGKLLKEEGKELEYTDRLRLHQMAVNFIDGRGDFFVRGEIGKDFEIYYQGEKLSYKNRELYWKGSKLSKYHQLKATETSDLASSFFYILVFLHLLHIAGAVIYLIKMTVQSIGNKFHSENHLSLRLGAIFWHFLGLLWLYLLLFLLFIH